MRRLDDGWRPTNRRERMPWGQRLALGVAMLGIALTIAYQIALRVSK